eukprot:COSAG01_NODE_5845_length_3999_cov_54.574872_2_plen_51_part_00
MKNVPKYCYHHLQLYLHLSIDTSLSFAKCGKLARGLICGGMAGLVTNRKP